MELIIDTQKLEDANEFGEALRNYCFVPDGRGDYGCYSTFKLRPEFIAVDKSTVGKEAMMLLLGAPPKDEEEDWGWEDNYKNAQVFQNGSGITLAYYWDGDGVLLFIEGDKKAINTDCKKSNHWAWID